MLLGPAQSLPGPSAGSDGSSWRMKAAPEATVPVRVRVPFRRTHRAVPPGGCHAPGRRGEVWYDAREEVPLRLAHMLSYR